MKLLFLGTGAADYNETHRHMDGYRRNSSALLDGVILIDPGPCVPDAIEQFGVDASAIKYIINTHSHRDHFNADTVASLEALGARFITFENGETKMLGGYKITALAGNHSTAVQHFIIDDGKSKLFYGLDGAWLLYDEVAAIKEQGIDFAIFDATVGAVAGDYRIFEHNNLNMVIEMKKSLETYIKRFCISHMARTLHTSHEELTSYMKNYDIEVAFDGLEIEI